MFHFINTIIKSFNTYDLHDSQTYEFIDVKDKYTSEDVIIPRIEYIDAIADVIMIHADRLRADRYMDIRDIARNSAALVTLTNIELQLRNTVDKVFWVLNRLQ